MQALFFIVVIFLITPLLLGCIAQLSELRGYIANGKLSRELRTIEFGLVITIHTTFYLALIATAYKYIFNNVHIAIPVTILLTNAVATITLSAIHFKIKWIYKNYSFFINSTITIFVLYSTWQAGSYAGGYITEKTNLSMTEFPAAVAGITLLYGLIFWALAISTGFISLYCITTLLLLITSTKPVIEKGLKKPLDFEKRFHIIISLSCGLGLIATLSLEAIPNIVKSEWMKQKETEILVESGYPLESLDCIKSSSAQDRLMILSSGEIAVAKFISPGKYEFKKEPFCSSEQ
ncbi:hypothetical protein [Pseudomonas nicosulfuronedens]